MEHNQHIINTNINATTQAENSLDVKMTIEEIEIISFVNKYKHYILTGTLLFTMLLYWNSLQNEFVAGDDYVIVVNNPDIRSFSNIPKFFTQPYHFMYCPVKMISHTIDYALSGEDPAGYHLFSILYHLTNVALVFTLVYLLLSNAWGAGIAALLFAVHPMNTEAVCWLTGRGDLLYGGFFFGGLIAYIYYLTKGFRPRHLVVTFLMFTLSSLSKASAFTFPLVLVVLDWYYRRKLFSWRVMIEKLPFFLGSLALGLSSIALRSGHSAPLESYLTHFSGIDFLATLLYPLTFYLAKFFVPLKLALPYPHPFVSDLPLSWDYYVYPFMLVILAVLIWSCKTIRRPLMFTVILYFATIVSALRITPMLGTIAADRYFYVAMISVVFFLGWAFVYLSKKKDSVNKLIYPIFLVALAGFSITMTIMTYERIKVFKNAITLFNDAHEKYPQHTTPLYELTGGYMLIGDIDEVKKVIDKIVKLQPGNIAPIAFEYNLMVSIDRYADAIECINRIVALKPESGFYLNKAFLHRQLNQPDSTLTALSMIETLHPDSVTYLTVMQLKVEIYHSQQLFTEALATIDTLLIRYPNAPSILMGRAVVLFSMGDIDAALNVLNTLIQYDPTNALAYLNSGIICKNAGRLDEACQYWQKAKFYGSTEADELLKYCQ